MNGYTFSKRYIGIDKLYGGNVMVYFKKSVKYILIAGFIFLTTTNIQTLTAKAETPTVSYDYGTQELFVTSYGNDKSPYFYIVVETDRKIVSTERIEYKLNSYGEPSSTEHTVVDTSGLNYKKSVILKIYSGTDWGDETKAAIIKISPQSSKITAKFNPNGEDGKKIVVTADSNELYNENWEYRTLYSNFWINGQNLEENLEQYMVYGTTLCIRRSSQTIYNNPSDGGNIASKEVKLKIPKKPNGPKAVVDPVKISVTIPAKCEWRIVGSANLSTAVDTITKRKDIWTAGWIKNETKKTYTSKELDKIIGNQIIPSFQFEGDSNSVNNVPASILLGVTLEFKTMATTKKMESKISYITLPQQKKAPIYKSYTASDINDADYTFEPVINTTKNTVTGLKFTNKTDQPMQVFVTNQSNVDNSIVSAPKIKDTFDLSSSPFTAVGANQSKVFPIKKVPEESWLVVRYTGKKANAKLKTDMELSSAVSVVEIKNYPTAASKELEVTLTTDGVVDIGKTKVKVSNITSNNTIYCKMVNSLPKFIELNATKDTLGLNTIVGNGVDVAVIAGNYIIAYECDNNGTVIKYGYAKVKTENIK